MSELTLLILRLAFLAVLWLFVFAVVYALRSDLFGQRVRRAGSGGRRRRSPALPLQRPSLSPPSASAQRGGALGGVPSGSPSLETEAISAQRMRPRWWPSGSSSPPGRRKGLEIELPSEQLAIGRSSESGLVIRDDYTSTHHARLLLWEDGWVIQDLDSTNGTFLDGTRVTLPTLVPLNTPVTIGTTTFELRR